MTPEEIISTLGMARHPEGGWYVETFRDNQNGRENGSGRGHSTAIYFLLEKQDVSAWHRVRDASEVWHFHAGSPLRLDLYDEKAGLSSIVLGLDLANGQRPQLVVPTGFWQTARSLGDWTLVGCTVAPGFDFAQFELAPKGWEPGEAWPAEM